MKKRIVVATGHSGMNSVIQSLEAYEVVDIVNTKDGLVSRISQTNPDILLITDALRGDDGTPITSIILNVNIKNPKVRIIYITNTRFNDDMKVSTLGTLVSVGVYDIIQNKGLTKDTLKGILDNPKTINDKGIQQIINLSNRLMEDNNSNVELDFEIPEEIIKEGYDDGSYKNVVVVSSIKPGTGKSFISTNIATAIAAYGEDTPSGRRPRVGLIEADLQNLSIGTLLQIEDNKKNMKTAIRAISTIITEDEQLIADPEKMTEVNEVVRDSFLPYSQLPNLEALVGSQLGFRDVEWIKGVHFGYLVDSIVDDFDVIVIDSNSSLAHSTTYSLLRRAGTCYYVLNLDFNNVRNNVRYRDMLKDIGIEHKVKYVLNEDVTNPLSDEKEELMFKVDHLAEEGFELISRVPLIPKTVFLNRLYMGTPIVLDKKKYTQPAKHELLKIANDIYPIKGFDEINKEKNGENKRGLFSIFG